MEPTTNSNPKLFLPLKTRIQMSIFTFVLDALRRHDYTLNRSLINFLDRKIPTNSSPDRNGVSTHDVTVDPSRDLWVRLFIPTTTVSSASIPVVIYFHGGGFVYLSPGSAFYDSFCRRLAHRLNAVIVSVNYRLAPEHKFPAQYEDAIDVIRFLDNSSRRKTIDPWPVNADITKCFIIGDSAGGNIAHNSSLKASEEKLSEIRVLGTVLIQPFFGGKEPSESEIQLEGAPVVSMENALWMWKAFFPDGLGLDHWACDVSGPNAKDLSGLDLPDTMVVVAGFDPLKDRQKRYCDWLKQNGKEVKLVEYPNTCHGFNVFPEVAEASVLIDDIKAFMHKKMT